MLREGVSSTLDSACSYELGFMTARSSSAVIALPSRALPLASVKSLLTFSEKPAEDAVGVDFLGVDLHLLSGLLVTEQHLYPCTHT